MRIRIFFFLCLSLLGKWGLSQKCFCDAAAKKKGNFYVSAHSSLGQYSFGNQMINPERSAISFGGRIGTNIHEKLSVQTGTDYYRFSDLKTEGYYTSANHQLFDIPVEFLFRFPNDRNGITPYLGFAAIGKVMSSSSYFTEDVTETPDYSRKGFRGFYAGLSAGSLFLISEKIAINAGVDFRQLIVNAEEREQAETHTWQISLRAGFQFHF